MIVETSTGEERSLFVGGVMERVARARGGGEVCRPSCECACVLYHSPKTAVLQRMRVMCYSEC